MSNGAPAPSAVVARFQGPRRLFSSLEGVFNEEVFFLILCVFIGIFSGLAFSNVLPQASHPLDYLSGREAATSVMPDDMGWMSLSHQNSVLHDPMGKPYLRSWNQ